MYKNETFASLYGLYQILIECGLNKNKLYGEELIQALHQSLLEDYDTTLTPDENEKYKELKILLGDGLSNYLTQKIEK